MKSCIVVIGDIFVTCALDLLHLVSFLTKSVYVHTVKAHIKLKMNAEAPKLAADNVRMSEKP